MVVAGCFWSAARDRRFGIFVFIVFQSKKKNTKAGIPRRTPKGLRRGSWLSSIFLRHESPAFERLLIVVLSLGRSLGQFDLVPFHLLVGNQAEEVGNTVQARPPCVVGTN